MSSVLKNIGSLFLSLLLAILVWTVAIQEQNPPREDDYNHDIPVTVVPPAAGLVSIDVMPATVRLRLLAPESSWTTLRPAKFKAVIDLSTLPAGFNDVPIRVAVSDPQIKILSQDPQVVTINLQAEQTITLPVKVLVMDIPPLGYVHRAPVVLPETVKITGPASLVGRVEETVSEVFIRNSKETITSMRQVLVKDRETQSLTGLKVDPAKVEVTLPIEQRFGYKDVSVSAVVEGQVAPGYWVSNVSVEPATLTIVGNPNVLSSIPGFIETAPVNLNQATADIVRTVPLNLPNGVTVVLPQKETSGASGVQVTVTVSAIESGQTVRRPVIQQGVDPAYWWSASPQQAEVILSGPIPRLQTLRPNDVKVIVDLFGLKPGVYKVEPTVFVPDGLRVEAILPQLIEITLGTQSLPLFSPLPSPTALPPLPAQTPTPLAR